MPTQFTDKLLIVDDIPAVTKLWNGRFRLEFFCQPSDKNTGWYKENIDKWLPAFGSLQDASIDNEWSYPKNEDVAYDNMRLVEASVPYVPSAGEHFVKLVYETLTDAFVAEADDKEIELENGLQVIERVLIAEAGVVFGEVVGTSTYGGNTLQQFEVVNTDAFTRVTARYSETGTISTSTELHNQGKLEVQTITTFGGSAPSTPVGFTLISTRASNTSGIPTTVYTYAKGDGQVFVSESAGPNNISGTTRRTIRAFGTVLIPDGVLIDSQDICRDGYIEYVRTTLDGSIEGVKTTYADVATVEVPGTVECTTASVSEGNVSGTIAITNSTPRRQKQVDTQVTIEVTTTPPTTAARAYDLGAISCSVTSIQTKLQSGDGSIATVTNGGSSLTEIGWQRSFASSASIQHYVGSYLTSSSSTGNVYYQSSAQPYVAGSNLIDFQRADSSATSTCTGTGATAADGYSEVGIISRSVNVVLTALDGTVYYQVVTEETV